MTPARPQRPPRTPLATVRDWLGRPDGNGEGRDEDVVVSGLTLDSRLVVPGDLYVAAPGSATHGARFAAPAVAAGAVAVVTDEEGAALCRDAGVGAPLVVVPHPRRIVGRLAARVYGEPAAALRTIGVTGTQGKTTTTRLAEAALEAGGIRAGVVGTIGTRIAGEDVPSALTTPEAPELHALFALMRERDVSACALEVSSHALVMGRVDGVVVDVAAFTNLGRDHLDFHADLEDYFAAKASLFTPERARRGVVNLDDAHGRRLVDLAGIPLVTFAVGDPAADWRAVEVEETEVGSRFVVEGPGGRWETGVRVPGAFNVANGLCAMACLVEAGYDPEQVAVGLASVEGVPGRLERVSAGQPFLAVVDYAHKPDAVAAALRSLRRRTGGRLILVLGAGGDRDRGKRPVMGEIAAQLADVVVVTDDNPRTEDAAAIRRELLRGARAAAGAVAELHEIGDRREAIRAAVALAREGDSLIVAGKGHETGQEVHGVKHPFDDRVELHEALLASTGATGPEQPS